MNLLPWFEKVSENPALDLLVVLPPAGLAATVVAAGAELAACPS